MSHLPFDKLLMCQTSIVQELGLYLSDGRHVPNSRDLILLGDLQHRTQDVLALCRHLEVEFWKRNRRR